MSPLKTGKKARIPALIIPIRLCDLFLDNTIGKEKNGKPTSWKGRKKLFLLAEAITVYIDNPKESRKNS